MLYIQKVEDFINNNSNIDEVKVYSRYFEDLFSILMTDYSNINYLLDMGYYFTDENIYYKEVKIISI